MPAPDRQDLEALFDRARTAEAGREPRPAAAPRRFRPRLRRPRAPTRYLDEAL